MKNKMTDMAERFVTGLSRRKFFQSVGVWSGAAVAVTALSGRLSGAGKKVSCCYSCTFPYPLVGSPAKGKNAGCPAGSVEVTFNNTQCPSGITSVGAAAAGCSI